MQPVANAMQLTWTNRLRNLLDPVTLVTGLGLYGFYLYYGRRFLFFVAIALAIVAIAAIAQRQWEIAIPIQTFFVGTWAYNFFEGRANATVGIMLIFLVLLSYDFWKLFHEPKLGSLTLLHGLYLSLATLIVWELALVIKLFWPVEPWSRTFVVVASLVFLQLAVAHRLSGKTNFKPLLAPLGIILGLTLIVIISTGIPQV